MKYYLMPSDLRDALIAYLKSKPYGEVEQGMSALMALREMPETGKMEADPDAE